MSTFKIKVKEVEEYHIRQEAETLEEARVITGEQYMEGTLEKPDFDKIEYATYVDGEEIL